MPPIIAFVGHSESGKTTLIEKLIPELKSRGYRVATVKHAPHENSADEPGKDSWRHIKAGSEATILNTRDTLMMIKPVSPETGLEDVAALFGEDPDIILADGFKGSPVPKIEIHRKDTGPLLENLENLVAVVTDEPLNTEAKQFSHDDVRGITVFLEETFIKPQTDRLTLYINDTLLSPDRFSKELIIRLLDSVLGPMEGSGKMKELKLFLKKKA
jgi:molybdopterin-guanine dinucleotide biosynthesis adapter protein